MSLKYSNYIQGSKSILDKTSSCDYSNISSSNINVTLSNISNQLKNIAIVDKTKPFKILNSNHQPNKKHNNIPHNPRKINYITPNNFTGNNSIILNNNYFNNTNNNESAIDNNTNNLFDITNISNQKFSQSLQKINLENFTIKNTNTNNNEELKKQNMELKENVKFLLKQVKKYQKNGIKIEENSTIQQLKEENNKLKQLYEKQISDLKKEINSYKNKLLSASQKSLQNKNNNNIIHDQNKELIQENKELRNFINNSLVKINKNQSENKKNNEITEIEMCGVGTHGSEIEGERELEERMEITNSPEFDGTLEDLQKSEFYDIRGFEEKSLDNINLYKLKDKAFSNNRSAPFYRNRLIPNYKESFSFSGNNRKNVDSEGRLYRRKNVKNNNLFAHNNSNRCSKVNLYNAYEGMLLDENNLDNFKKKISFSKSHKNIYTFK